MSVGLGHAAVYVTQGMTRAAGEKLRLLIQQLRLTKFSGPPGDQWAYDRLLLERLKVKIADQAFNTAMGSLNLSAT
jgi:hypothetical protein